MCCCQPDLYAGSLLWVHLCWVCLFGWFYAAKFFHFVFSLSFFATLGEDKKNNLGKLGMVVLFFYEEWNGRRGLLLLIKKISPRKRNIFLVLGVLDYLFKVGLNVRV